ncbi:unnamed protein product [Moneuplotes crassus]|uniref:Uncharacterized protein n=1 Tax=Euplotes crassus TaxID=5936 RepID=A0AAD1XIL4_EUPCR|nr:unnamed protein product [Moneuplotes crassus]
MKACLLVLVGVLVGLCVGDRVIGTGEECYDCARGEGRVCVYRDEDGLSPIGNSRRICCSQFDYIGRCGSSHTVCTDKAADVATLGRDYLLCDEYNTCENYKYYAVNSEFSTEKIASIAEFETCILKLYNHGSESTEIILKDAVAEGMTVYMYSKDSSDSYNFTYQGSITDGKNEMAHLVVDENLPVYFVVIPDSKENSLSFSFKAVHSRKDDSLLTLMVVFGSVGVFLFFMCGFCCFVRWKKRRSDRKALKGSSDSSIPLNLSHSNYHPGRTTLSFEYVEDKPIENKVIFSQRNNKNTPEGPYSVPSYQLDTEDDPNAPLINSNEPISFSTNLDTGSDYYINPIDQDSKNQ